MKTLFSVTLYLVVALLIALSGCSGATWPSRAFTINLPSGVDSEKVVIDFLDEQLTLNNFSLMARGGYEELTGNKTGYNYKLGKNIIVSLSLSSSESVLVRLNENISNGALSKKGEKIYSKLYLACRERWPGRVQEVKNR